MSISTTRSVGALVLLAASPGLPAQADEGGFYGRLFGGVSSLSDTDLSGMARAAASACR